MGTGSIFEEKIFPFSHSAGPPQHFTAFLIQVLWDFVSPSACFMTIHLPFVFEAHRGAMQQRTILSHVFAESLRRNLLAGGLAVAFGIGFFVWSRYDTTTAVLSFDADAARQAEPGVMTGNAKDPAVALAQSILSDEAVRELERQARVPFASSETNVVEFRSRLDIAQTSDKLLRVNYKDTDKKLSAAVANAVANMLVAWMPSPVQQGAPPATPALAKSGRQKRSLDSRSPAPSKLESQLTVVDRKLAALYAQAIALQKADAAAPPSNTQNKHLRKLNADEIGRLHLERTRLTQAIVAEKQRGAAGIWQRPFTLVKLALDAGPSQSESGLLSYGSLAVILCGLLYLVAAIWRYLPVESAAPLRPPALNEKLSTEKATEHAGSRIQVEDGWANEVLKSLSLTGLGREDETFAARHKPVAVDSQRLVGPRAPEATGTNPLRRSTGGRPRQYREKPEDDGTISWEDGDWKV
jgi:hypothetical protein